MALLLEHVVERFAYGRHRVRAKIGRRPDGRKTGCQQQLVGLPEWDVEGLREAQDHFAAWLGTAELKEADVSLRTGRCHGQLQLRLAAGLAPPGEARGENGFGRHNYLPRS